MRTKTTGAWIRGTAIVCVALGAPVWLTIPKIAAAAQEDAAGAVTLRTPDALRTAVREQDGLVRFEFAARPGVWGDGRNWNFTTDTASPRSHCPGCTNGPIRIAVRVAESRETLLRSRVGGPPGAASNDLAAAGGDDAARDLGVVARDLGAADPTAAARYLFDLVEAARPLAEVESKESALRAAVSANGARVGPRLLRIARNRDHDGEVRKAAMFWASQMAGSRAAEAIEEIAVASDEETEVQEAAVFALTQLPDDRGTEALLRVARQNRNPEIVRTTYFWLGQTEDPRALALFEEILLD